MTSLNPMAKFVELVDIDGQKAIEVRHPEFFARLFLQGAHLTHFAPAGDENWLWLSPTARYAPGVAIRGGIPVCWPWFGDPTKNPPEVEARIVAPKAHGFARTQNWIFEASESSPQEAEVRLSLDARSLKDQWGDWPLKAELVFRFTSDSCQISLTTRNLGEHPASFTEALHSYFPTSDIDRTAVSGFDNVRYTDTLDQWQECVQSGAIKFFGEVDRIYHGSGDIEMETPEDKTRIQAQGSSSTVVWNPGPDKAARLSDFPDAAWRSMLCVETANAMPNCIRLIGGESHTTQLRLTKS